MSNIAETIKDVMGISSVTSNADKLRARLEESAMEKFQVAEWRSKLYITVDCIAVKDSFENISDIISELALLRSTWVEYMFDHPKICDTFYRAK